jgi:hypothetical protein
VKADSVPIPTRVRAWHPLVTGFKEERDWHFMARELVPQAAHILQGVVDEATRRGIQLQKPELVRQQKGLHLALTDGHGEIRLRVLETPGSGGAKRRLDWESERRLPAWLRSRSRDFVHTGRLEIRIWLATESYRVKRYGRLLSPAAPVVLGRLFVDIEAIRSELLAQQLRRKRWEEEKAVMHERHVERDRLQRIEDAKATALMSQVKDSEESARIGAFARRLRSHIEEMPEGPDRAEAEGWLAWTETYGRWLDPLARGRVVPRIRDPW